MYQAFGYKNAINGNKNKKRKQKRENTFRTTSEGLNPLIQQQVTDPQSTLSLGNLDMEPNTRVLLNNGLGQDSFESFREHFEPSSGLTNEAIAVTLNSRSPLYGNEEKVSLGNSNDHIDSSQAVSKENEDSNLYHLDTLIFKDGSESKVLRRKALFDTGCEGSNWVRGDIVEELGALLTNRTTSFVTLEGNEFRASQVTKLSIQEPKGKRTYSAMFFVNPHLPYDLVLGAEFCKENNVYSPPMLGGLRTDPKTEAEKKAELKDQQNRALKLEEEKKKSEAARQAKEEKKRKKQKQ